MIRTITLSALLLVLQLTAMAQTTWHNPQECEFNPIEGQYWQENSRSNFYNRFPDSVKLQVREAVWNLSTNTAGESINFRSNSKNISIRYTTTSKEYSMTHMPATGVSGVDLYATDKDGEQIWLAARYGFSESVAYNYHGIKYREGNEDAGYEYRLFLPAYNGIEKLEIGVDEGATFKFIEPRREQPIVAYGTSITQGACASRPGMIWTSIVSRRMDMPLYNIGFSGNGRLEDELIDLIADIDASVYLIDCMPNLQQLPEEELVELIVKSMKRLRERRPDTPIILMDHLGYPHSGAIEYYRGLELNAWTAQERAFKILKKEGMKSIYHIDNESLGMEGDATVEAIHPTDWGMTIYADAYEKVLRKIIKQ